MPCSLQPATMLFACVAANCQNMNDWLAWAVPEECRLKLEVGGGRAGGGFRLCVS